MRNSSTTLTRPSSDLARASLASPVTTPPPSIPTIRLVAATPLEANTTLIHRSEVAPWANEHVPPMPLAPKADPTPRKRLVPKKSKLSMLGTAVGVNKERGKDFSDVVRRVGGSPSTSQMGGYEIYVDPAEDPDIGDILLVKKKKSRAGLDGLRWGTLGEVTNVPAVTKPRDRENKKGKDGLLKIKGDENQKWWSIGRGRKDSKEKEKSKDRARSPVLAVKPLPPIDSRARFNSLDSGILLNSPIQTHCLASGSNSPTFAPGNLPQRSTTPTLDPAPPTVLLVPPSAVGNGKNSVALRAMRSVRSLARIGSWAQLKNMGTVEEGEAPTKSKVKENKKDKEKEKSVKKKKKKEKEKDKEKEKEKAQTKRHSGSSFEAGALSASPEGVKTLGKKKVSILGLGLGLPATMRLPSMRSGSTASSVIAATQPANNRLSTDSATILGVFPRRDRSGSVKSGASSLRPLSTSSGVSGSSGSSSICASVRWDEVKLETVKEMRRKEKAIMKEAKEARKAEKKQEKKRSKRKGDQGSGSKKLSDSRRRTPLADVFPVVGVIAQPVAPVLTLEEASNRGHSPADEIKVGDASFVETPVERARPCPRPLSEDLLGRSRPRPLFEDDEDNGVISLLDAATNDLAQLINHLNLEATPAMTDCTPLNPSPFTGDSPTKRLRADNLLKKGLRTSMASVTSLRPYAQSLAKASTVSRPDHLGQNIAPWTTLSASISPAKSSNTIRASTNQGSIPVLRLPAEYNQSPAPPADSSPVFKPLQPATAKYAMTTLQSIIASPSITPLSVSNDADRCSLSSHTFGWHSKTVSQGSISASPVFKKAHGHVRKRSSLVTADYLRQQGSIGRSAGSSSLPILPEARRNLGLAGTMGGSVGSNVVELDANDPDSDIPGELQVILSGQSDEESVHEIDDTLSFRPVLVQGPLPSPGLPPPMPLPTPDPTPPSSSASKVPVFRALLIDEEDNHADIDESGSEDDTKKSFDFTGELQKLNQSGASDRRSFVEQLENAFRTPAKIDLRYAFDDFLASDAPPIPELPLLQDELVQMGDATISDAEFHPGADFVLDVDLEPSLLPGSDSLAITEHSGDDEMMIVDEPRHVVKNIASISSRPSNGQLNRDFKFGGRPSPPQIVEEGPAVAKPLTLSDIIPSPSHVRSLSSGSLIEDDSVLKSIFAKASEIPSPPARMRLDSDSSSKRVTRDLTMARTSNVPGHHRNSSEFSFAGFDSFAEVRRGFEFANRPDFYPPPGATARCGRRESVFSMASVSSYGHVINPGSADPFEYATSTLPSLCERPYSDDYSFSMSVSVDDTFSFINRQPRRKRVDSDASSFYFRAHRSSVHPYNRGHRRHESSASVSSTTPPISIYNRNFGHHRRNDSNTSTGSVAQSYAMYGASGGRLSWAKQRADFSDDTVMSDRSMVNIGRPGLGDKMLESALDYGMPLAAISASPPESLAGSVRGGDRYGNRTIYDSIMDDEPRYSLPDDSLFDKTGYNSSADSSDFVFGDDPRFVGQKATVPTRYRPISSLSEMSIHSPPEEDDTMISMLGGGHVRRRSVGSQIGASPCVRVEKRKQDIFGAPTPVFQLKSDAYDSYDSPRGMIVTKPSIASTTNSFKFGDERMIRAKHGLLQRQSLEESALIAEGEDASMSMSFRSQPVFTRPSPAARSRSNTCTSSSGTETPPLSACDGYSSLSEGSQSSIDLSHINYMLNITYPMSNADRNRIRPRARGQGHRRRISQARASRASIYETIEEEISMAGSPQSLSSAPGSATKTMGSVTRTPPTNVVSPVFVVDPETSSVDSFSLWDDERGITALRKYYALRDEAQDTVQESKRVWHDTAFSTFAVQSFDPPRQPGGMRALLEHSIQNYGPLPSQMRLRRIRSRTHSRPSPYPRQIKTSFTSSPAAEEARAAVFVCADDDNAENRTSTNPPLQLPPVLRQVSINPNIMSPPSDAFNTEMGGLKAKPEKVFGLPPRPRVASIARRTALGWAKRSNGRENKENANNSQSMHVSQGVTMTPAESLRLNRPRPRGRPTSASVRPIRV